MVFADTQIEIKRSKQRILKEFKTSTIVLDVNMFKQIRERAGMTQAELAEFLEVTVATLSRWENGKHQPALTLKQIKLLDSLLKTIGVSISELPDLSYHPIKKLS